MFQFPTDAAVVSLETIPNNNYYGEHSRPYLPLTKFAYDIILNYVCSKNGQMTAKKASCSTVVVLLLLLFFSFHYFPLNVGDHGTEI